MSEQHIVIRRAIESDAKTIAEHRLAMFRDMRILDPSAERVLLDAATTHMREAIVTGEYIAWLAHPRGEPQRIVGGGGVQLRRLFPRPDDTGMHVLIGQEGIILNVYVDPDFRRRGIARKLMQEILAWVPGTDVVQLVLHASDDGRALYESLGFVHSHEMRYARALR